MWKFTYSQRLKQKEMLFLVGKTLIIMGGIGIGSAILLLYADIDNPITELIFGFGLLSIYFGVPLKKLASSLTWHRSRFWDFFFNQFSTPLVFFALFFIVWSEQSDILGLLITLAGFQLVSRGAQFSSSDDEFDMDDLPLSGEISTLKNPI